MALTRSFRRRPSRAASSARAAVRFWLVAVAALVFLMVLVGGATRLTESGLSITQWKPVTGVIPPLSAAEWQAEFDRYKQIPQFAALNPDMTIEGFKTIFWWEWGHRLLARIVGAAFILPALWFWMRGQLKGALGRQVAVAAGLLALEPIVGWWMVSSGLSERTEVAQERLALHLLIAAGDVRRADLRRGRAWRAAATRRDVPAGVSSSPPAFARGWSICQLGLGALVAGLRAGLIYNTWPLMGRSFVPGEAFPPPWLRAMLDDPGDGAVRSPHARLCGLSPLPRSCSRGGSRRARGAACEPRAASSCRRCALLQVGLGVATLLSVVPIGAGAGPSGAALVLFGLAVWHWRATLMERGRREAR